MYGLVLEGGGTKGAYHIGAYDALVHEGLKIGAITGTSIGALNGAMLAQGDVDKCRDLWENVDYSMIINISEEEIRKYNELQSQKDLNFISEKLKLFFEDGGLDISPLKETIDKYIDEDRLRNSRVKFGMVTVNISDLRPMELFIDDMPRGRVKELILASAYLPIFKRDKKEGNLYLDGAFYDNLPFSMLEKKGYDKLILVRTYGAGLVRKIDKNKDYIIIAPNEPLGNTLDFDREKIKYNMELGYFDTLKVLRGLEGRRYYIRNDHDEGYFMKKLLDQGQDKIDEIARLLNLGDKPYYRLVFEDIVPRLAGYLEMDKDFNYGDLLIRLLELKAENLGINRFSIYSYNDLVARVKDRDIVREEAEDKGILGKIRKTVNIPMLNKDRILLEIANIIFS